MKPLYESVAATRPVPKRLTDAEILKKLKAIRDKSLLWWEEVVESHQTAGSSTASEMYRKAVDEIHRIEDRKAEKAIGQISGKIELVFQKEDENI